MNKPRQFITLIPTKGKDTSCTMVLSRQYTKDLAERDIYLRMEEAGITIGKLSCLRELIVDEDGVIRLVDDNGEVLSHDIWKV